MSENGKINEILTRSYEISYALWRISANITDQSFADKIAEKSIELISFSGDKDYTAISEMLFGLKYLINFCSDIGVISVKNREILFKEIGGLEAAIADLPIYLESFTKEEFSIENLFSNSVAQDVSEEVGSISQSVSQSQTNERAQKRQSLIFQKIKESGNCRLADILAILPDLSERTVRYDLESLVERKLIERVGVAGRGIYYRIPGGTTGGFGG